MSDEGSFLSPGGPRGRRPRVGARRHGASAAGTVEEEKEGKKTREKVPGKFELIANKPSSRF